ncbi:MAG: PrgI family protein [Microgenomates group bacterium]|nr:PrgI family protein [Microgenomates group bacterium]
MEQHPIPRQITTFEFKLIGFMTLRQFIYLVIFLPLGFIVYKIFPIPILNIALGLLTGLVGVAFAFFPINERPLEFWIKNFLKAITSPTQYFYKKNNPPIYFFEDLYFVSDPHLTASHIESQQKLKAYLEKTRPKTINQRINKIQILINKKNPEGKPTQIKTTTPPSVKTALHLDSQSPATPVKKTFFVGTVRNNKKIPLPGILVYIKNQNGETIRLLKTNPHGIFATYNPFTKGEYLVEVKDPSGNYFFDTMKIKIEDNNPEPVEFFSKELL